MTGSGVVYMLTGPGHAVRLAVSLWSLRKHFAGPVAVYTTQPESHAIGERLAADRRLGIDHRTFVQASVRKNSSFLTKVALLSQVPYETALFLDADTLVVGDIAPLLALEEADECHATQFANWQTTTRVIRRRIESWRSLEQRCFPSDLYRQIIADALRPQPAINSGVFGFRPTARILAEWNELTFAGRDMFICDEIALQIILHRFPHRIFDCRFNCSPIYSPDTPDPRIWHFHGEKHVARPRARALWLPAFRECVKENVGGVAEWSPAGDRRLKGYLASQDALV